MKTSTIKIQGMTCGGCVASVTKALQQTPGVQNVQVTLSPGQAEVVYDDAVANELALRSAVEDAGFDVD